jgi:anti-sigma regulatory factor (Ser/Thr protein kinase)
VVSKSWDNAERASAEQVDRLEPAWAVWYGVGSRRFYAVARWATPVALTAKARSVEELRGLMHEAEAMMPPPGAPARTRETPLLTSPPLRGESMTETPDGLRTACWDLPHELAAVAHARNTVKELLASWGLRDLTDDVVLVVGELLGNAISHGAPPIRLSLWATAVDLCVRVTDHGTGRPRRLDLGLESVHGRGLTIVAALAGDFGVIPLADGPGKTVWARWPLARTGSQGSQPVVGLSRRGEMDDA